MRFQSLRRALPASSLFLAMALLTACSAPSGVREVIDALNADVAKPRATATFDNAMGAVRDMSLVWHGTDAEAHSPQVKVQFKFCSLLSELMTDPGSDEDCSKWERKYGYLLLANIDPNSIKLDAGEFPSISYYCEAGKQCGQPSPVGMPCADQQACQRVSENLGKLVRYAHGGTVEPPSK